MGEPQRVNFWGIPMWAHYVFWFIILGSVAIMFYGIYRRYLLWKAGKPEVRTDRLGERFVNFLRYAIAQLKILRQRYPAFMHLFHFWAFTLLFLGTALATLDADILPPLFGYKLLAGHRYLFYKLVLDLSAFFMVFGMLMAWYRRYVVKMERLDRDWRFALTTGLLILIGLTGLITEGLHFAGIGNPSWGAWAPIGFALGHLFGGMSQQAILNWHLFFWFFHFLCVGTLFATLPLTQIFHVFLAPVNIFFGALEPHGALVKPIENIEEAEILGVGRIQDFTWHDLFSFDACVECGRCQDVCPAYATDQPLSPKKLILSLREYMTKHADQLLNPPEQDVDEMGMPTGETLFGEDGISYDTIWACTTCDACMTECPVLIEHVPLITEMRRYATLMEGVIPDTLGSTLNLIERSGNPWGISRQDRTKWADGLDVPLIQEKGETDILYWVGCAGAYDPRNQKVSQAIVKILKAAGVDFAILGNEEQCCGDSARRAGNEWLYQTLAEMNIETLKQYKFNRILVQCPHGYNTLLHEYPKFGGKFEVVHHSQLISELLTQGKIRLRKDGSLKYTFHDPCYLGRYNGIYEEPREVILESGFQLVEMEKSRDKAMCCGGGGAHVWMEDKGDKRINYARMDQVVATGAEGLGVACPFCMIMLTDAAGAKGVDETLEIKDIAEIVAEHLEL